MSSLPPQAIQFAASLAAILLLALVAHRLGLGPTPRLEGDSQVHEALEACFPGFGAEEIARARDGRSALARDSAGHVILLRAHGSHFAGRVLGPAARSDFDGGSLIVDSGEKRFGATRLEVADPLRWQAFIAALAQEKRNA